MIDPALIEQQFGVKVLSPIIVDDKVHTNLDDKTDNEKMQALYSNVENIKYISQPTDKMWKYAVSRNPKLFKYCKKITSSLRNLAVELDPNNLEYVHYANMDVVLKALNKDGMLLKHSVCQWHHDAVMTAVSQNGLALQFAANNNINYSVCVTAVLQNEDAIKYVPERILHTLDFKFAMLKKYLYFWKQIPSNSSNKVKAVKINPAVVLMFDEIEPWDIQFLIRANCKVAQYLTLTWEQRKLCLDQHKDAIKYLNLPTPNEYEYAVKCHPGALEYIKNQTNNMIMTAVTNDGMCLQYVNNQTRDLVNIAVEQNPKAIQFVRAQFISEELILGAIEKDPCIITLIPEIDLDNESWLNIYRKALSLDGMLLQFIKDPSEEFQRIAIENTPEAIQFIMDPPLDMQLQVVKKAPEFLQFIKNQSIEACKLAVRMDPVSLLYISRDVWNDLIYLSKYDK